jgi:dipeptidyl aminopeptidase/acylaminoacyl peptidase
MRIASLIVITAAVCTAAPGRFTLEQVMSAPFPSDLQAGPGGRVAWVLDVRGVRNVWVAEPPDYRGRQVTKYTEDDGQDINEIAWLPDGRSLLYVKGGDFEYPDRENPNPRSRPEGVEQAIWLVSMNDGSVRKLADGNSPAPSPAGDRVVFIRSRQIWSTGLDAADKPVQLIQSRGRSSEIQWSPDGRRIVFTSQRGDHAFVGVYDAISKDLKYLDPSVDLDMSPVWSPDSKQVAFIRIPSGGALPFGARRTADQPWSIRIADAATGAGRQLWRAQPGQGSVFHAIVGDHQVMWTSAGRLVFPWERDGWSHLYSVSSDGGDASLLTHGDFEVEHVALSSDRRTVIYSSNQDDVDRRHIWRVAAAPGERPQAVTRGSGIEWSPLLLDNGNMAYLHSGAQAPARAAVQKGSSAQDMAPDSIPSDFPKAQLVVPQQVILSASDGMMIHGQLFLPPDAASDKHPALIFFHGGSRRQMLLGWHYMYYYNNAYAMNQYLANLGYIVLSVNYRSGIGYGLNFREALNYGASGASEFNDVMGAGLYMRARSDVDPQRIGLWGGSYGGYLTALGLARASDLFAAGVDFHGVHDWSKLRNWEPNSPDARTAFESSPMAAVKTWHSPVLLIHGDDDRNVPFSETVRLAAALRAQGVDFEQLIFPDEIHDFLTWAAWHRAYSAGADFFARKLKPGGNAARENSR